MIYANSVTVSPSHITLQKGKWYYDLCAIVSPSNATYKSVEWCSSNEDIVAVNESTGYIYARSVGTATICATACDGSEAKGYCIVTVKETVPATDNVLVTSITIDKQSLTLGVGASEFLHETVCPPNATKKSVEWSSSNKSVATVNPSTGLVYAVGTGTAVIYATACDDSGVRGICQVTVVPPVSVTGITICPTTKTIKVGEKAQLFATVSPGNATNKKVLWASLNNHVAFVDPYTGCVSALNPGIATIRATTVDGDFQATCEVLVGYSAVVNGRKITVIGEDNELTDDHSNEQITGLTVFANDLLITSAREEDDGDITVCMGEIVPALCTEYLLNPTFTEWNVATSHKDLQIFREKTYYTSELGLCPFDNINDRISLFKFIEDMGYSSKYSSVSLSNGAKVIIIQGHDWYSASSLSSLSDEEILSYSSLALSLLPYVGDAKDAVEGVYGKDIITGETLSIFDRLLCIGCSFVQVVNGVSIRVGRKGLTKIDNVVDYADNLSDGQKAVLRSDIWNILKPTTRGLWIEELFARSIYNSSKGWYHLGKELNGFFPVIDFIKSSEKIEDTLVVSLKTIDPRLYKLADDSYDLKKMEKVLNGYASKLRNELMFVDDIPISKRQLDIVVPKGYSNIIEEINGINKNGIVWNLTEL